jgi:5-methylcytosine-specific restriction endonuclease McrA
MKPGRKSPPKDVEKREKQVGKYTHHWCEHHMVWTVHKPADCPLGKQHKEEQKKKPQKTSSATFAAATATAVNPQVSALMASIANPEE